MIYEVAGGGAPGDGERAIDLSEVDPVEVIVKFPLPFGVILQKIWKVLREE